MITATVLLLACLGAPEAEAPAAEEEQAIPVAAEPTDTAPSQPEPTVIRDPRQVQEDAEAGRADVRQPEQVQDEARAAGGDPFAKPPNPKAVPSEGVRAVGSSGIAPLPPPPDPVPPSAIPRGSWRGVGWLAVRMHFTGAVAGDAPARARVISLGGGAEGGWRVRQWVGVGAAFSRQVHEVARVVDPVGQEIVQRGFMSAWDLAFVRFWAPVKGRVEPYIDVGGGLAFVEPARTTGTEVGGTVRGSLGLDIWVARNVTLGMTGLYRASFVDTTVGHAWQAALEFAVHW